MGLSFQAGFRQASPKEALSTPRGEIPGLCLWDSSAKDKKTLLSQQPVSYTPLVSFLYRQGLFLRPSSP